MQRPCNRLSVIGYRLSVIGYQKIVDFVMNAVNYFILIAHTHHIQRC